MDNSDLSEEKPPRKLERRRERVTYEEVAAACTALQQQQQRPSVRLVMQQVGGGSPKTINEYLRAWERVIQGAQTLGDVGVSLSEDFRAALAQELTRHGDKVRQEVGRRSAELEELYALSQESCEAAVIQVAQLEQRLDAADVARQQAEQQLAQGVAELQGQLGAERLHHQSLGARLEAAQSAGHQAELSSAELRARLTAAEQHLQTTLTTHAQRQQQHDEARAELAMATQQAAVAQTQARSHEVALQAFEQRFEEQRRRRQRAEAAIDELRAEREKDCRRAEVAEAQLQAAQQQIAQLREDRSTQKEWWAQLLPELQVKSSIQQNHTPADKL